MRTVIIDVDSTLVDFQTPLYNEIKRSGIDVPPPYRWFEWDTPKKAVNNNKLFYNMVDNVHRRMDRYTPFPLVKELFDWLKTRYFVVIATHRNAKHEESLRDWLHSHQLYSDAVHISHDKTVLLNDDVEFIFDDHPRTIGKANSMGIWTFSLWYPYNQGLASRTFDNVGHFLGYLMQKERYKGE